MENGRNLNGILEVGRILTLDDLMKDFLLPRLYKVSHNIEDIRLFMNLRVDNPTKLDVSRDLHMVHLSVAAILANLDGKKEGGSLENYFPDTHKQAQKLLEICNYQRLMLDKNIGGAGDLSRNELFIEATYLVRDYNKEFKRNIYLVLDSDKATHFNYVVNADVASQLPLLVEHLQSASRCFACGFWHESASKFLIIIEAVVQLLAKDFGVDLNRPDGDEPKQWSVLLDQTEKAIKNSGKSGEDKKEYLGITARLKVARLDRNDVVHARDGKVKECDEPYANVVRGEAENFINAYARFLSKQKKTTPSPSL